MIRFINQDTIRLVFDYPLSVPDEIVIQGCFDQAELFVNENEEWTGVQCKLFQWELFLWESLHALTWLPPTQNRDESLQMLAYYKRELKQSEWAALLG